MGSSRYASGPLTAFEAGFREQLVDRGYARSSVLSHVTLLRHLSRWLAARDLTVDGLTGDRVDAFLAERRRAGYRVRCSRRGLRPLLSYLEGLGVLPATVPTGPMEVLLEEFVEHLSEERGLAVSTIERYRECVVPLLAARCWDEGVGSIGDLSASELASFLRGEAGRVAPATLNTVAMAVRVLARFLHVRGYTPVSLASSVPGGPPWRHRRLPRAVTPEVVAGLLVACDRTTVTGRRDVAILLLLSRLGLRAGEVCALDLDDVDWRAGTIVVSGKGARRDRLPLPGDVGEAIAGYLWRGRPSEVATRSVFVHVRAPHGRLHPSAVWSVVAAACDRAGVARVAPHALRHTAATRMRREGASLFDIGQVLRHQQTATTAIYAAEDLASLAPVVRAWPGGRP